VVCYAKTRAACTGGSSSTHDSFFINVYPGDVHRELELLVRCGLTPAQALTAATRHPAEWLRAENLGTIAVGKLADLVLLQGDPLADIRNTQRIELVMQGGRLWTPKALLAEARR
jgi:imidazolonepropionase-like amidohydrolase